MTTPINNDYGTRTFTTSLFTGSAFSLAACAASAAALPAFIAGAATGILLVAKDAFIDECVSAGLNKNLAFVAKQVSDVVIFGGAITLLAGVGLISAPVAVFGAGAYLLNKSINALSTLFKDPKNQILFKLPLKCALVGLSTIAIISLGAINPVCGIALGALVISFILYEGVDKLQQIKNQPKPPAYQPNYVAYSDNAQTYTTPVYYGPGPGTSSYYQ